MDPQISVACNRVTSRDIANYFWDLNKDALRETRQALRDPAHPRFLERMVALLSRCDQPRELFTFLPKETWIRAWPQIRRYWLKRDRHSVHRDWWETMYEQWVQPTGRRPQGKPADLFRKVGETMKERRLALELSQKQLAVQTQLSQSAVSQIEEGKKEHHLLDPAAPVQSAGDKVPGDHVKC